MKRLLIAALVALAACSGNGSDAEGNGELSDSPGLIAYMRFAEDDELPSEVVIANESGDEQRTARVQDALRLVPTDLSDTALVVGGQGSSVSYVLDARGGEARPVDGAEDLVAQSPQQVVQGKRYMVLMSPEGNEVALLDLQEARLTDLTETIGDVNFVSAAHVSPDDRFVAVSTTEGLWLMPTDEPSQGRAVSDESTPFIGGFAQNGDTIVFTTVSPEGAEVLAAPVDSGDPETLANADEASLIAVVSPKGNEVALLDADSIDLVSVDGDEKASVELAGESPRVGVFSSSGNSLLVQTGGEDATYELVDLEGEQSQELDALDGLRPIRLPQQTAPRWLLFSDTPEAGLLGERVVRLDLDNGDVKSALSLEGSQFNGLQSWSPDGRFVLVVSFDGPESSLFLVDLEAGESREIAKGAVATGSLSYDGSLAVVAEAKEAPRDARIFTVPTEGGERSEIGPGLYPVWVKP